jgi:predicted transcriptional regulator
MTSITIQIPESIRKHIEALADREGYSFEQFAASALSEKLAVMSSLEVLRREASQGNVKRYHAFLDTLPDVPPIPGDEKE